MSDPFDLSSAAPIEADPAPVAAPNDYLASLKEHGTTAPFAERMFDFDALTGLVGTDDMLAAGKRYDGENET